MSMDNKMFYLARDYQDRRYPEDLKLAVTQTTRDVFNGSHKVIAPYLDPVQHRRLECLYDPRLFLLIYFFDVLIDQSVYTLGGSLMGSFQSLNRIPKFYGILGGAFNQPPEQLLLWFQIYNSKAFCGSLGNVTHLFYRMCEYHFLIRYPRMIEAAHRDTRTTHSLRSVYKDVLSLIEEHIEQSIAQSRRGVFMPYMNLNTVKTDQQLYSEWLQLVLTFTQNTLSDI